MTGTPHILLIYTGGTIGMVQGENGELIPFNFSHLLDQVPELKRLDTQISVKSLKHPIDSSNMNPEIWKEIGDLIFENYNIYNGFVVLHGSDTMSYTASALSLMFQNLTKPIILTGSQLPINTLRTDGKENLITSIELASNYPSLKEVAVYFEFNLYRGNRTSKVNTEDFEAFFSYNYPVLAEVGVNIKINNRALFKPKKNPISYNPYFSSEVTSIKIFPGISREVFIHQLNAPVKGILLETFGAGNAPNEEWLSDELKKIIKKGVVVLNTTQCLAGGVNQEKYETGRHLAKAGVIDCKDMTFETAICKLMYAIENEKSVSKIKRFITNSIAGEISK